ncbi:MAG: NADH-quinone oxidoreductase subunit C [Pelagibacteraceae bacterium]|jgi:NADH-quinone oxidoreductase subunit C|nr:NADH-quinone oxidoreductase subunit C [Pelagibacteraceae bacterium]HJL58313.1 NADH-quinone oxidoreductase subunit C [Alphaproteobacteria bacterium]MBO6466242.1 NADH-quinone oxidoreductase subunit C [Pelagibacteraceae bacterium]MBO6467928.1 NADH-quinone oxidoreductase subunit C [Pelagibacteraceae bacterium]MBO6469606.1 NADH-quinone oxidoreductase subunit C [Pelagibacteraceae bacterium]|tara:strand:- start:4195 stop:4803 length:609 start_codon:yes stop_codon:yes gene_type:complete
MSKIEDTKKIILKESNINVILYDNEKYLGIIVNNKSDIVSIIKFLNDNDKLFFKQLIDITAIDYPSRELRFEIVYLLISLKLNQRILVKTSINENDNIESISSIHKNANWYERECYDLFGINFLNHPDLRRIMTDYNFEGHPLRKDFPLTGHNEVSYSEKEKKIVYEKVKLSQEYRSFDYSSPWEGLKNQLIGDEKVKKENL